MNEAYFNDTFCNDVLAYLPDGWTVADIREYVMGGEPEARPTARELATEIADWYGRIQLEFGVRSDRHRDRRR
jgi:hypothetical protein